MATLDDKLLGEKLHYYCSSSEDEGGSDTEEGEGGSSRAAPAPAPAPAPGPGAWDGSSANTGPKGVLKDWQRFKQLETEMREEAEVERMNLAKRLALTCKSDNDEEKDKKKEENVDRELEELLDDGFLESYMQQRMQEMIERTQNTTKRFGTVKSLDTGESFLAAVDQEDVKVTVIILVYEPQGPGCVAMQGCLDCLAQEQPGVKFCKILSTAAGLSRHFKSSGVPALIIYRAGQLLHSFVRMTDQLGEDFFASDVEGLLLEHGLLPSKEDVPKLIRGPAVTRSGDSDDE